MLEKAPHNSKNIYDCEHAVHYAEGSFQAGGQGYVQPHAPRKIVQYPTDRYEGDSRDPRVVEKLIDYDADGNQTTIKKKTADPEDPVAEKTETLRRYRWDEEDRLRAVDLAPENDENRPEVATYTYDADGQRSIKYVPEGLGAHYSAKDAGRKQHLATMLYPSPLLTVEALDLPTQEELPSDERTLQDLNHYHLTRYTKHYFIGSERLNSTIGSQKNLGVLCEPIYGTISAEIVMEMNDKVENAGQALESDYTAFDKTADLGDPFLYSENEYLTFCGEALPNRYAAYWFHPDHLGSSNYITDLNGNISQHLEYFPFGETLVEEHKNSNNSPYKFNAKELDDETGNYYYGARYLNPKFSIWLSVDPLAEKYPGWSPYNYTLLNPVKLIDPDGRSVEEGAGGCPWPCPQDNTAVKKHDIKRYFGNRSIDNRGNISIDGFMKDGQGMESRSWKRGETVSHISYEELSNIGNKAAPSRTVRWWQSIGKFTEVSSEWLENNNTITTVIKPPQIEKSEKKNLIPISIPDTNYRKFNDGKSMKYRVNDTNVKSEDINKYRKIKERNSQIIKNALHSK